MSKAEEIINCTVNFCPLACNNFWVHKTTGHARNPSHNSIFLWFSFRQAGKRLRWVIVKTAAKSHSNNASKMFVSAQLIWGWKRHEVNSGGSWNHTRGSNSNKHNKRLACCRCIDPAGVDVVVISEVFSSFFLLRRELNFPFFFSTAPHLNM